MIDPPLKDVETLVAHWISAIRSYDHTDPKPVIVEDDDDYRIEAYVDLEPLARMAYRFFKTGSPNYPPLDPSKSQE